VEKGCRRRYSFEEERVLRAFLFGLARRRVSPSGRGKVTDSKPTGTGDMAEMVAATERKVKVEGQRFG
jgi:hypothetical protein